MSQNASLEVKGMRFAVGSVDISTATLVSEAQLREELARREPACEFLNPDVGGAKHFYLIEIRGPGSHTRNGAIGIASEGHGLAPQVAFNSRTDTMLVGFEKSIAQVDLATGRVGWRVDLESLFVQFLASPNGRVLILEEIGLRLLDEAGREQWRALKDIVEQWVQEQDCVMLRFMDMGSCRVRLADGTMEWISP